jgi:NTE family protein
MSATTNRAVGLVLTSGGARGAYQAGAIRALAEILKTDELPFSVLSGISAGSINAAYLASQAHDFSAAASQLSKFWCQLRPRSVFQTDSLTLTRTGFAWLSDLGLGGWIGSGHGKSLLKTSPLKKLLSSALEFDKIDSNLKSGLVRALAVTATSYSLGISVTFFDGASEIDPWVRSTRIALRAKINLDHILASSAIPVFFPAIKISDAYYGDGCIRMNTPLSPAIHLGAEKIIAIGVRHERTAPRASDIRKSANQRYPYLAEVGGVILNSMFLDALEGDVERMERINQTLSLIPSRQLHQLPSKLRRVPVMVLKPSRDLGNLVVEAVKDFSFPVRYLLKGIGATGESGWDLLSYLAFDSAYTSRLVDLGYEDTMAAKDTLRRFMQA